MEIVTVKKYLKQGNIKYLINKKNIYEDIFELINYEIECFDFNRVEEYDYLYQVFNILKNSSNIIETNVEVYKKIELLLSKIRELIRQNHNLENKLNDNYRFLKQFAKQLEMLSASILYNYIDKYNGPKDQFFEFVIFDIKNQAMIQDIFERFPHLFDFSLENSRILLDKIIDRYLASLEDYVYDLKEIKLQNVIYYNYLLKKMFKNNQSKLDNDYKRKIIRTMMNKDKNNKYNKERHSFYINDIVALIKSEDIVKDEEYLTYKYDIPINFNAAIHMEVSRIENNIESIKGGNKHKIYTFDNKLTKDIDDGVSIEYKDGLYDLGIHIADPLYFFRKDSILLTEADRRKETIYLSDQIIPMFPSELVQNYMSLNENRYIPMRSYYFKIDPLTGEVINYEYKKENAFIYKNMTYQELDDILLHGCDDVDDLSNLLHLERLCDILKKGQHPNNLYYRLNRSGDMVLVSCRAHSMIETLMTFVNHYVADYYNKQGLPFIYRNHVINKDISEHLENLYQKLSKEENNREYIKSLNILKDIYPKAMSGVINQGHYGLGLESYTHITSPIRRYEDILANIMQDYLEKDSLRDLDRILETMDQKCHNLNSKRKTIKSFKKEYEKVLVRGNYERRN